MERISDKTTRKKKLTRFSQSITLNRETKIFLLWLQKSHQDGVNISDFTRELWKMTPEYKEFQELDSEARKEFEKEAENYKRR